MAAVDENKINNLKKIVLEELAVQDDEFEKEIEEYFKKCFTVKTYDELIELINPEPVLLDWLKEDASKPEYKSLTEEQQFRHGLKLIKLYDEMERKRLPTI